MAVGASDAMIMKGLSGVTRFARGAHRIAFSCMRGVTRDAAMESGRAMVGLNGFMAVDTPRLGTLCVMHAVAVRAGVVAHRPLPVEGVGLRGMASGARLCGDARSAVRGVAVGAASTIVVTLERMRDALLIVASVAGERRQVSCVRKVAGLARRVGVNDDGWDRRILAAVAGAAVPRFCLRRAKVMAVAAGRRLGMEVGQMQRIRSNHVALFA